MLMGCSDGSEPGVKGHRLGSKIRKSGVKDHGFQSKKKKVMDQCCKVRDRGQRSCIFESQRSGVNARMSCVVQRLILEAKGHGYGSKG